jgi:hypothetical protein
MQHAIQLVRREARLVLQGGGGGGGEQAVQPSQLAAAPTDCPSHTRLLPAAESRSSNCLPAASSEKNHTPSAAGKARAEQAVQQDCAQRWCKARWAACPPGDACCGAALGCAAHLERGHQRLRLVQCLWAQVGQQPHLVPVQAVHLQRAAGRGAGGRRRGRGARRAPLPRRGDRGWWLTCGLASPRRCWWCPRSGPRRT